jgi:hypothetical protein
MLLGAGSDLPENEAALLNKQAFCYLVSLKYVEFKG